jgi:hypothetical protein
MVDDRSALGLLVAALGAFVLAVSVFLPWYGVSITASGAASAQQELATVAQQYGNPSFQAGASQLGAEFSSLAGRQVATVSAHEALKDLGPMLLIIPGVATSSRGHRWTARGRWRPDRAGRQCRGSLRALPDALTPGGTGESRVALPELGHLARPPERGSDRRRRLPVGLQPDSAALRSKLRAADLTARRAGRRQARPGGEVR